MSNTLDSIINRRKKDLPKQHKKQDCKSKDKEPEKEESWFSSRWYIVVAVVIVLIVLAVIFWFWWRTPAVKQQGSILDEMKSISAKDCKRVPNAPGVMSLADFREYHSQFSRNCTETDFEEM